jgi:hypothetical protein
MYPRPPQPPTHSGNEEFEEYPLNDTRFIEQRPVMQSPFIDVYPADRPRIQPYDSNQPLLRTTPPPVMPMPSPNNISYNDSAPGYYTVAPRRQPRRYKTSKSLSYFVVERQFICFF